MTESDFVELNIPDLVDPGITGITATCGQFYAETAAVCLKHNNHGTEGVAAEIREYTASSLEECTKYKASITYSQLEPLAFTTHADLQSTVEHAAYGVAILTAHKLKDFKVTRRSVKGTGFDFWLADDNGVQDAVRLEASGLLRGSRAEMKKRVRQKCAQTAPTDHLAIPKYIVVVNFEPPALEVVYS